MAAVDISIPCEKRPHEYRAALTPAGVEALVQAGHRVYIEHEAGIGAGFEDESYEAAGGRIVYNHEEALARGHIVVKVSRPTVEDLQLMHEDQILVGFLHLAAGRHDKIDLLRERRVCAIGWETVQADDGFLPVLHYMSTIAGRLMPQIVGRFMQSDEGGRGVTLGGCSTVPPAEVVILGAGTFGSAAARALAGNHASVYLLDSNARALERADRLLDGRGVTMAATDYNMRKMVRFADAVIGAVYRPGQRAPIVLSREHIASMRPRSLFVDASIDQGGCAETSRRLTSAPHLCGRKRHPLLRAQHHQHGGTHGQPRPDLRRHTLPAGDCQPGTGCRRAEFPGTGPRHQRPRRRDRTCRAERRVEWGGAG